MRIRVVVLVAVLAVISTMANAQVTRTGSLSGTVVDGDGLPLPGVAVMISSPGMIGGTKGTVTTDKGKYRFPSLTVGVYRAVFRLGGFTTVTREGVEVNLSRDSVIDVEMPLGAVEDEITITGETPVIDPTGTSITTNISTEFIAVIPNNRNFLNYLNQVPGIVGETVHGSSERENTLNLDGFEMSDPFSGEIRNDFSTDIVAEMSVQTGTLLAENESSRGGVINVVTKSGGNEFRGSAAIFYTGPNLVSNNTSGTIFEGEDFGDRDQLNISANLGGPIKKDTVWFFFGLETEGSDETVLGFPHDDPGSVKYKEDNLQGFLKLSSALGQSSQLIFSGNYEDWNAPYTSADDDELVSTTRDADVTTLTANLFYQTIFGSDWLFDVQGGYYEYDLIRVPHDDGPRIINDDEGVNYGGWGQTRTNYRTRKNIRSDLTYLVDDWGGDHQFKGGLTYSQMYSDRGDQYPDSDIYRMYWEDDTWDHARLRSTFLRIEDFTSYGIYLQDQWRVSGRVTLNLGFRWDNQQGSIPPQGAERDELVLDNPEFFFDPEVTERIDVIDWKNFSPRLSGAWDVTGNATTIIKGSYGRFFIRGLSTWIDEVNPNDVVEWRYHLLEDGSFDLERGAYSIRTGSGAGGVDPNLETPYMDEYTLGVDQRLGATTGLTVRYIRKYDRKVIDDVDRSALDMDAYERGELVWTNYREVTGTDPVTGQPITFWEVIDESIPFDTMLSNPPGNDRDYQGLEIVFRKRMSNNWALTSSYVYAKSTGLIGLTSGETELVNPLFNNPNAHVNAYGRNETERRHQLRASGAYVFNFGLDIGAFITYVSGERYTREVRSRDAGLSLEQGTETNFVETKGSRGYPDLINIDLRLRQRIKWFDITVDVFNLLNDNTVTDVETRSGYSSRDFEEPRAIRGPRTIQLGLRFSF